MREAARTRLFGYAIIAILVLAAVLRLQNLGHAPPGLNQDEASSAWNAYCLLKTGTDQFGEPWPIFYARCLGGNRSTLHIYILLLFQALGGLSVQTTRLPSAIGGVISVWLMYVIGRALFDRKTGLVAAVLLCINPWHIQQSRWGHDGALGVLLVLAPLAALLWAGLLPTDRSAKNEERPWIALLAGLLGGICCYGYQAVRLFLPAFIGVSVLVNWRGWWDSVRTRRGRLAVLCYLLGWAGTFAPLVWTHLTDPEINRRGAVESPWTDTDPFAAKTEYVFSRYASHFGPDFLFVEGDVNLIQSPPGSGQFHWYMLPLMLSGLYFLVRSAASSRSARIVLVWLILYPVGDCYSIHASAHALRSLPGIGGLILLASLGALSIWTFAYRRYRLPAIIAGLLFGLIVGMIQLRYAKRFFIEFDRDPYIYHHYHVDLLEACEWLRSRMDDVDSVFFTPQGMNMPYVISLIGLRYEPAQWFQDERITFSQDQWINYARFGSIHFLYGGVLEISMEDLQRNGRTDRVVFVIRPNELGLSDPVHRIVRPDGREVLWICEQYLPDDPLPDID